ncbi:MULTISPECIES: hypothetical protein [Entomomonas]|uniref:Uncharacterized protein n=1 Tax=Entomomonas asaccharolytica TaxID=2785331 RepID=A0A974NHU8_9GAMM|nr:MULTISPECIES: hypothetical protein [Entomomonas]QQP86875.1 hypothetical protein JHT90_06430 [Entomomonas asaccharolytica]UYZ83507.1 hypothetical protein MTZ49_13025 [Entomomonas sp. E2T0]
MCTNDKRLIIALSNGHDLDGELVVDECVLKGVKHISFNYMFDTDSTITVQFDSEESFQEALKLTDWRLSLNHNHSLGINCAEGGVRIANIVYEKIDVLLDTQGATS